MCHNDMIYYMYWIGALVGTGNNCFHRHMYWLILLMFKQKQAQDIKLYIATLLHIEVSKKYPILAVARKKSRQLETYIYLQYSPLLRNLCICKITARWSCTRACVYVCVCGGGGGIIMPIPHSSVILGLYSWWRGYRLNTTGYAMCCLICNVFTCIVIQRKSRYTVYSWYWLVLIIVTCPIVIRIIILLGLSVNRLIFRGQSKIINT